MQHYKLIVGGWRFRIKVFMAKMVAITAHSSIGQKRKYTGDPYWHHPRDVVAMMQVSLISYMFPREVIFLTANDYCTAWLHDVVEDTWVKPWMIRLLFGKEVRDMVMEITDVSKPSDGNRALRKALDREHLRKARPIVKAIKVFDCLCNLASIAHNDKRFAVVYVDEMIELLPAIHNTVFEWRWNELRYSVQYWHKALNKDSNNEK